MTAPPRIGNHEPSCEELARQTRRIVHAINNQLMALLGNTSLVLDEAVLDPLTRGRVEAIAGAARRVAERAHELLALSSAAEACGEEGDDGPHAGGSSPSR